MLGIMLNVMGSQSNWPELHSHKPTNFARPQRSVFSRKHWHSWNTWPQWSKKGS